MSDRSIRPGDTVHIRCRIFDSEGNVLEESQDAPDVIVIGRDPLPQVVEEKLLTAKSGQTIRVEIRPADCAFGEHDPDQVQSLPKGQFAALEDIEIGALIEFATPDDERVPGVVLEATEDTMVVDFNHPLIGRHCIYEIEIVSVLQKK